MLDRSKLKDSIDQTESRPTKLQLCRFEFSNRQPIM